MWSVYLDTSPFRVGSTRALGSVSNRAFYGPLAALRAREIGNVPLPGARWLRVRNLLAGISERDLDLIHLSRDLRVSLSAAPLPRRLFLGTEVVGEVTDIGADVRFFRIGDRVVYQRDSCCITQGVEPPCRHCAAGNEYLCENRYASTGLQAVGGGWSEEMVLHEQQLFLVPDALTNEQAVLLDLSARCLHAVLRALPQPGDAVLVIGAETVGLLTMQAVRALAPNASVTALPLESFQVEQATRMGATRILYQEEGGAGAARLTGAKRFVTRLGGELLAGGGFDVVYDTLGTAATLQSALRWVRESGKVVLSGHRPVPMNVDLTPLWEREVSLLGALAHGTETIPGAGSSPMWNRDTGTGRIASMALAAALLRERRLTPEALVTHRFPLREIRSALMTARQRTLHATIKVLLDMREIPLLLDPDLSDVAAQPGETAPEGEHA